MISSIKSEGARIYFDTELTYHSSWDATRFLQRAVIPG